MNNRKSFLKNIIMYFIIIFPISFFGQQVYTKIIHVVKASNEPIVLYAGEILKVEHLEGEINECPYDKKKKKGGFMGIGRKTVTIRINHPKSPAPNRRHPMRAPVYEYPGHATTSIREKRIVAMPVNMSLINRPREVTFFIPGQCTGRSYGTYTMKYTIDSEERYRLLSQYLINNSIAKEVLLDHIQLPKSNLFNDRLKQGDSYNLSAVIFNAIEQMNFPEDRDRFDLYKAIFYHINTSYLPMLKKMTALSVTLNEFKIFDDLSKAIGASFDRFNPSTYYHRYSFGKIFKNQGDAMFKEKSGLNVDQLGEASFLYSNAAYAFLSIGEKSEAIESMLKLSRTLQRFKRENSLLKAEKAIATFKDTMARQKWYYIDTAKEKSLIIADGDEYNVMVQEGGGISLKNKQSTLHWNRDIISIKDRNLIFNLEEFIMMPGAQFIIEDSDLFDSVTINAIRSAFGTGTKITAKINSRVGSGINGKHKDSNDLRGQGSTNWTDINGQHGEVGREGKNIVINSGIVYLDGLTVTTNGGRGQKGGDGGNGCKGKVITQGSGSSRSVTYFKAGKGGNPGLGGFGGAPGKITINYFRINSEINIDISKIKLNSNYGSSGKEGKYGLTYTYETNRSPIEQGFLQQTELSDALKVQQSKRKNKQNESIESKVDKMSRAEFESLFIIKRYSSRQEWSIQNK